MKRYVIIALPPTFCIKMHKAIRKEVGDVSRLLIKPRAPASQQNGIISNHKLSRVVRCCRWEPAQPGTQEARGHARAHKSKPKVGQAVQTLAWSGQHGEQKEVSPISCFVLWRSPRQHVFPRYMSLAAFEMRTSHWLSVFTTQRCRFSGSGWPCFLPERGITVRQPLERQAVSHQSLSGGDIQNSTSLLTLRRALCISHVRQSWWPAPEDVRHNSDCC